jgi:uncharacterized protein YigE (DUF2233 family)
MHKRMSAACCLLLALVLAACSSAANSGSLAPRTPLPTLMPTRDGVTVPPPPAAAPADDGWQPASPGVELRRMQVPLADGQQATVSVVRLDPRLLRFRVGYRPGKPQGMAAWQRESGALAIINGGFFDAQNISTALVVSNGTPSGSSYQGRGGMFAVDSGGNVSLRFLGEQPYDPGEALVEAMQSWPMLVKPGGTLAYTSNDNELARRSVVALDRDGRVLLIACSTSSFTLRSLADWLLASDLNIDAALNLDGGSSTGLYMVGEGAQERIDSFVSLPLVLLVYGR